MKWEMVGDVDDEFVLSVDDEMMKLMMMLGLWESLWLLRVRGLDQQLLQQ